MQPSFVLLLIALLLQPLRAQAQYANWKHAGSVWILTDKQGADLPAEAVVEQFPLLVKLYGDWFDFKQAQPRGEDLRFATKDGTPLAYEIDEWDSAKGEAAIWVRVPKIVGNTRQELRVFWGKSDAKSESNGAAVFNESNGYVAVWHMNDPVTVSPLAPVLRGEGPGVRGNAPGKDGAASKQPLTPNPSPRSTGARGTGNTAEALLQDSVGVFHGTDTGTTETTGMIGRARHFPGGKGIFCGDKLETLPSGASSHSTEAWFRIERPNTTLIGWGNEGGGRGSKVRMMYRGPHHIRIDSDFADVRSELNDSYLWASSHYPQWVHVAHTYDRDDGRIYIRGELAGEAKPRLDIKSPARLWLGGWYHNYDYVGDLDEVRISKVARSRDWIWLQNINQETRTSLVGHVAPPGNEFEVSYTLPNGERRVVDENSELEFDEGQTVLFHGIAGGAQCVRFGSKDPNTRNFLVESNGPTWRFIRSGLFSVHFELGHFEAVYSTEVKSRTFKIKVRNSIPAPWIKVVGPKEWNGRDAATFTVELENRDYLKEKGVGEIKFHWNVSGLPVHWHVDNNKLVLERSQGSGPLQVEAIAEPQPSRLDSASRRAEVSVVVPSNHKETWQSRPGDKAEQPEDGQFIARDDNDDGTLHYTGKLTDPADSVFVRLYADEGGKGADNEKLIKTETAKVGADKAYSLAVKLKAGLIKYRTEFGTKTGDQETVLHAASNLVCGDVFLINGQSNAVATDFGKENSLVPSDWVRTFGATAGDPNGSRLKLWANAQARSPGGKSEIGYWGMELGRRLVESQKRPICLINGAVGGTRIDQHQRNDDEPTDPSTIYGRLLWRVQQAKLTHGVRGILWHQGENDQGADGPTGDYGSETYRELFFNMAVSWKNDYPNVGHYYVFQIWPKSCSMGINGSDNVLREIQRTLPNYFSNLSVMSTLGIKPPGGCHFPAEGYAEFARLIAPVIEQKTYGRSFDKPVTPPNLKRAFFSNKDRDEVTLAFDQPVVWDEKLKNEFVFRPDARDLEPDQPKPVGAKVVSGSSAGSTLVLKLDRPAGRTVSYIDSDRWSPDRLLYGQNGLAALSFYKVVIENE